MFRADAEGGWPEPGVVEVLKIVDTVKQKFTTKSGKEYIRMASEDEWTAWNNEAEINGIDLSNTSEQVYSYIKQDDKIINFGITQTYWANGNQT